MTALYFKGVPDAFQRFLQAELTAKGHVIASRPEEANVLVLSPLQDLDSEDLSIGSLKRVKRDKTSRFIESLPNEQLSLQKVIFLSTAEIYGEGDYICGDCGPIINYRRDKSILGNFRWEMFCPICGDLLMPQPVVESSLAQPLSVRGQMFSHYEGFLRRIQPELRCPVVVLRLFSPYWPDPAFLETRGVLATYTRQLLAGEPIEVFEDGNQMRDFTHSSDVLQAIERAIQYRAEEYHVYNIGSGQRIVIQDLAAYLQEFLNRIDVELIVTEQYREEDVRHRFACINLAWAELGYRPQYGILQGMEAFCNSILATMKAPAGRSS
jgi:dTDP-L-rhamnose 4-epimerase